MAVPEEIGELLLPEPETEKERDLFRALQDFAIKLTGTVAEIGTTGAGSFTTLTTTGNVTLGDAAADTITFNSAAWTLSNGTTITGTWTDLGIVTTVDINGGTVNGLTSLSMSTGASITEIADEDDMVSNSATKLSTQQSIKAYTDATVASTEKLIKGWINLDGTGTIAINDSFNVTSITDNGVGLYTITWDVDFADTNYAMAGFSILGTFTSLGAKAVGSMRVDVFIHDGSATDQNDVSVLAIGDQ